jgi:hypothetical protein
MSSRTKRTATAYGDPMSETTPRGRGRLIIGSAAIVVIAVVVTVLVSRHHGTDARGARDAKTAATLFVGAINSGSGDGAAAISCTSFADAARSAARSGADPGISYALGAVTTSGTDATAVLTQSFDVAGSVQKSNQTLTLAETGGLWLVCGRQ